MRDTNRDIHRPQVARVLRAARGVKARAAAGFTLVELMVSLTLLGLIMTVIFSLFSTTSDGLREADSLVGTLDGARFAMTRLSSDMKSAGAFATPDATRDRWVIGKVANRDMCVSGVASYVGWQNSTVLLEQVSKEDVNLVTLNSGGQTQTAGVSFDGFILMGALSYPMTFEITNMALPPAGSSAGTISANGRGLVKLLANDPFNVHTFALTTPMTNMKSAFAARLPSQLIRIADQDGNLQFGGISNPTDDAGGYRITITPALQVREGGSPRGLARQTLGSEDVGYDAALIDAFWYHVDVDPNDPTNFRLVRDRVDAREVARRLCTNGDLRLSADGRSLQGVDTADPDELSTIGAADRAIITDRVVDFQVWFDCADANGNVSNTDWVSKWASPGGVSDAANDCMNPNNPNFGAARMAHMRLSVRTADERADAPTGGFLDESGVFDDEMTIRYFRLNPSTTGAARVVTVQADVDLTTFGMHNITSTTPKHRSDAP